MNKKLLFSFVSCVVLGFPMISFAQTSEISTLSNTIDTVYEKIVRKKPKSFLNNWFARKIEEKFWNTIQSQLENKIASSVGDVSLIYRSLLAKVQQRSSSFQFSTNDILVQMQLVDATNQIRKNNNLSLLKYDILLSLSAYNHANDMYKNFPNKNGEMLSHYGTDNSTVKERVERVGYSRSHIAENIARNQKTIEELMNDWMNSPSHRANILSSDFTDLGVSKVGPYRVQNFGKKRTNK